MSETRIKDKKVEAFDAAFRRAGRDVLDPAFHSRETPLYLYHRRSLGGVDFQYIPKFPLKEKLTVEQLETMARTIDALTYDRGYVYEYFDNDFILRIEVNPNHQSFGEVASLLHEIRSVLGDWRCDIKINRIDIAIDYPFDVDLALVSVDRMQKECGFWTRDKFNGLYFGSPSSNIRFRLYDKALERKRMGVIIPAPYYRVELEYREPHFMQDSQVRIAQAFRQIRFHGGGLRQAANEEDRFYLGLILFKASHVGLSHVLAEAPRRDREYYRELIEGLDLKSLPHPLDVLRVQYPAVESSLHTQIKEAFGYEVA